MSSPVTLRALIDAQAAQFGDKPFVVSPDDGAVLTYRQLREDCRALGARLAQAGLHAGDTVSVFMGNGIQTARVLLGAMYNGLTAHPINLLSQPSQLHYVIDHSDTRMIFVAPDLLDAVRTAADGIVRPDGQPVRLVPTEPTGRELPAVPSFSGAAYGEGDPAYVEHETADGGAAVAARPALAPRMAAEAAAAFPAFDAQRDALLMYTSGTTGTPKGVVLTHANLCANAATISAEHRLGADDRVLGALPLYHINGLVVTLLAPLAHGGSVVMPARFSASTFWRDAAQHGCTWINVVPTIIAYLLNGEDPAGIDLSALKFCRSASAALPPEHHRAFETRFGIGVIETMGMTETAAPVFSNPYDAALRRVGSIGLPSGAQAKVIDREGRELGAGEVGEIVLRGAHIMRGYLKREEETRAAFTEDGWLRTGDLGYHDADGYFYINGRAKELIIKGGENIAPREIDEALLKHPDVLDAAAVGVPDPAYGQDIVAFVVPREGRVLTAESLRAHCLTELGRFKTPKEFRMVESLPRGPSGKVQRLKLVAP